MTSLERIEEQEMKRYRFLRVLKIALLATVAVGVVSFLVMNLWNVLMPSIFAVQAINFWQALGLLVLSKILFGSFRPYARGGPGWRHRMSERWEGMTPEEREKFKQGMRGGCGPFRNAGTPTKAAEATE
jgi:hypothetical protein